jgi:hypothetical protein
VPAAHRRPRLPASSAGSTRGIAVEMPASSVNPDEGGSGRNETHLERCDRNLVELLQEVRVVQTGVQVLFAFLLMAPLTPAFEDLGSLQRAEYFVTLALAGAAAVLLIAPTAYHRALFRLGDKEYLVTIANRLTIAGLAAVGMSMVGAMVFVTGVLFGQAAALVSGTIAAICCLTLWVVLPLVRRLALSRSDSTPGTLRGPVPSSRPSRHAGLSQAKEASGS